MDFGNITDDVLDYPYIDDGYELSTLRENLLELNVDEDIIHADYNNNPDDFYFTAWTENYVIFLDNSQGWPGQQLRCVKRNPK